VKPQAASNSWPLILRMALSVLRSRFIPLLAPHFWNSSFLNRNKKDRHGGIIMR
jgi:hypothetical protein